MQSFVFLTYFLQKLLKKNLWGGRPVKEELKEMNAERIFRTRFNNTIKYPWKRQLRKVYVLFVATIGCKFDDMYMCILLKFEYAKFRVSNLFFQKLLKKNLWGGRPVKEELKEMNAERIFRTRFNNTIKYP